MALLRCLFTCGFLLCWALLLTGTAMHSVVVGRMTAPLQKLPASVAVGFGEALGFRSVEEDARTIRDRAAAALSECAAVANVSCPGVQTLPFSVFGNSSTEQPAIASSSSTFRQTLPTLQLLAGDEYFGSPELRQIVQDMTNVSTAIASLGGADGCIESGALHCRIYIRAGALASEMREVLSQAQGFASSEAADALRDAVGSLSTLHGLPSPLLVAMIFVTYLWCGCWYGNKGQEDFRLARCSLVPFSCCWSGAFMSTILVIIVASRRSVAEVGLADVDLPLLRGDVTDPEVLEHIRERFPQFYDTVFAEVVAGLHAWALASGGMLVMCIMVMAYTSLLWSCEPYRRVGVVEEFVEV